MHDLVVVGGGIVGLATARAWATAHPGAEVVVVEKEDDVGRHQTSRNSGVVHAGLYYEPGSLKARLCTDGRMRLAAYARDRGIPYDECGKLVVAVDDTELDGLRDIHRRATANGVPDIRWLEAAELRDVEPHATGVAAVHSPRTAITDFAAVARAFADDVCGAGGVVLTRFDVVAISERAGGVRIEAADGRSVEARHAVTCAGLWSDRVAQLSGDERAPAIVPFRGDYFALRPDKRELVRGLIYPVPDPRYPFLGIHLTRTVHGEVLVGPNAILATAREGYRLSTVRPRELAATVTAPGFAKLARQHWRTGVSELHRSLSRRAFAKEAARYVPALQPRDLVRASSGVRAQCVEPDGTLLHDFCVTTSGRVVNVRNAPSPAATSSLAIAEELVSRLDAALP